MAYRHHFGGRELLLFLIVLAVAAGARVWYLWTCADNARKAGPLRVQEASPTLSGLPAGTEMHGHAPPTEQDALIANLKEHQWFGSLAPLAGSEEKTAHVAPGYPWLLSLLERAPVDVSPVERTVRWIQAGLGALTAAFYFLFALRAFGSRLVAGLAGLFCALHPFWVINTAEINDGVLATFLVAASLFLGARGTQSGAPFTSLLYGLALAGLALVRAALLPFAIVAVLWFLLRCRSFRGGWLCAVLAFLGFLIGICPWTFRNYNDFKDVFPVVDAAYLHLWMGNNELATGGPETEATMLEALAHARGQDPRAAAEQFGQLNQKERYDELGRETLQYVADHPAATLQHRFEAAVAFLLGEQWLRERTFWQSNGPDAGTLPDGLADCYQSILAGTLLGMLLLALLGWRWTYAWRRSAMPASLAFVWIPLPYVLSHASVLQGPRLPLDGVLLGYAAFALVGLVSPVHRLLFRGPEAWAELGERRR